MNTFIKDIHCEHVISKVVDNKKDLVAIKKSIHKTNAQLIMKMEQSSSQLAAEIKTSNQFLFQIKNDLGQISNTLDNISRQLDSGFERLDNTLYEGFDYIGKHLTIISVLLAANMAEQKKQSEEIIKILNRPYFTGIQELLDLAYKFLMHAHLHDDESRKRHYEAAFKEFSEITKLPVGSRSHLAWFEIGWLQWKVRKDYNLAIIAFSEAVMLSEVQEDKTVKLKCLRHLAYMFFLIGVHEEAYKTIKKAFAAGHNNPYLLYDAALYEAHTNRNDDFRKNMKEAIWADPTLFITLAKDKDFIGVEGRFRLLEEESNSLVLVVKSKLRLAFKILSVIKPIWEKLGNSYYSQFLHRVSEMEKNITVAGYIVLRQNNNDLERIIKELETKTIEKVNEVTGVAENESGSADQKAKTMNDNFAASMSKTYDDYNNKRIEVDRRFKIDMKEPSKIFENFPGGCGVILVIAGVIIASFKLWGEFKNHFMDILTACGIVYGIIIGLGFIITTIYGWFYNAKLNQLIKERTIAEKPVDQWYDLTKQKLQKDLDINKNQLERSKKTALENLQRYKQWKESLKEIELLKKNA